ncbi:hypothetical protein [uncultured Bacteroides sp.]|uniref:hypothetical protein n=2 Tax=uncultured Bacteroides sp. TaxID=162156 RepID=UPI0027296FE7|nr:hypothetical protein [uncultured Bacteroides sp.]
MAENRMITFLYRTRILFFQVIGNLPHIVTTAAHHKDEITVLTESLAHCHDNDIRSLSSLHTRSPLCSGL